KAKHRGLSRDARFQLSLKQGRPLYGVEMKIVDAEGRELPRDGKSAGNLLVRGPWILRRYYKDAGGDPLTPDGWLPTGDVGTKDALLRCYDGKIAKWWLPDDVVFVDELPHTATGKLSKLTLRERFKDYRLPA